MCVVCCGAAFCVWMCCARSLVRCVDGGEMWMLCFIIIINYYNMPADKDARRCDEMTIIVAGSGVETILFFD